MPISGIVIRTVPERQQQVIEGLKGVPGVELHEVPSAEVLVAVLDAPDFETEQALSERILALDGVRDVSLAYHNFEDMVGDQGAPRLHW